MLKTPSKALLVS